MISPWHGTDGFFTRYVWGAIIPDLSFFPPRPHLENMNLNAWTLLLTKWCRSLITYQYTTYFVMFRTVQFVLWRRVCSWYFNQKQEGEVSEQWFFTGNLWRFYCRCQSLSFFLYKEVRDECFLFLCNRFLLGRVWGYYYFRICFWRRWR